MFDKIKRFYSLGLWTEGMVRNAVIKGVISEEEYAEITGQDYTVQQ